MTIKHNNELKKFTHKVMSTNIRIGFILQLQ